MANELFWGLGNSLLTVILGHMTISVEFLAANAVMGNLNRLFLVVCFGLGAATAVMIGKAIGEGQSHDELMDLSRTLSWVTILVGAALAVIALALVPLLFRYPAGRRRCVLVHGAGSGTPVAGGAAADGPAGAGAGRGSLVRVAGHTGGELYQVSHLPVAHPVP